MVIAIAAIIMIIIAAVCIFFVMSGAKSIVPEIIPPEVSVSGVSFSSVSLETTVLNVSVSVVNKNAVGADISNLKFDLYAGSEKDKTKIGYGNRDIFHVDENGTTFVDIPVTISNKNIPDLLELIYTQDNIDITVKGSCGVGCGYLALTVPFEETRSVYNPYREKLQSAVNTVGGILNGIVSYVKEK